MGIDDRLAAVPEIVRLVERDVSQPQLLESEFVSLLRSSAVRRVVDHELTRCMEAPVYYPALAGKSGLTLARGSAGSLALNFITPGSPTGPLLGSSQSQLLGVLGHTRLVVERFEQPQLYPVDRIDPKRRLVVRGQVVLEPGEHLALRAGHDVVRMWSEGDAAALVLVLVGPPSLPAVWSYDPLRLEPTRVFSSDTSASRIENMTKLLAHLGDDRSFEVLDGLLEHPSHSVRWAAAVAAWRRDPVRGRPLLERCARDEHPAVRRAAQRRLDQTP